MASNIERNLHVLIVAISRSYRWISLEERAASVVLHCGKCNGLETISLDFLQAHGPAVTAVQRHIDCGDRPEGLLPPPASMNVRRSSAPVVAEPWRVVAAAPVQTVQAAAVVPVKVAAIIVRTKRQIDLSEDE